jgi:multidrug resistance efflux pump
MADSATILPSRRSELIVRSIGDGGPYVIKDPHSGAYFQLGDQEHFLLMQLDGRCDAVAIGRAFAKRFGQTLDDEDLESFLEEARNQGFLQETTGVKAPPAFRAPAPYQPGMPNLTEAPLGLRVLYWRKSIFDPDRCFNWLAPKLQFCWTRSFVCCTALCIAMATLLVWQNRQALGTSFMAALRWETAVLAWLVLMLVTTCHEFAHGLTCKHYGGEVHEVGFLLMFFMPCFYCNVSDAWLFPEKSKRIWVTLAGGFCELFLWALAVFLWRLTMPGTLVNYLAFVVLSACGVQTLFNFNPLLKLDGYYLLSDWLEIPNLQQRSGDYIKGQLRWLLWGAPPHVEEWHRSAGQSKGRLLLLYGLVSWLYSLIFLGLTLVVLGHFLGVRWGWLGLLAVVLLTVVSLSGLFHGFTAGEVRKMILFRHKRTVFWLLTLTALAAFLSLVQMEEKAGGSFRLRPATRAELRASVAGFLREVSCDEGDRVSSGKLVARLEVPDLYSRLAQKQAEIGEVQAKMRLLNIGPRPEEIAEQRLRVARSQAWCDLAQQDLLRSRRVFDETLDQLEKQILACTAEMEVAQDGYQRSIHLVAKNALPGEQLRESKGKYRVSQARFAEAQAAKRAHQARGTLEAETEVAKRNKELADARGALRLLEAGTRPEEIQAEQARLARLQEEARHLERQQEQQTVVSPVAGLVSTPRLKEKLGQYLREGDLICVVEESAVLEAEISLAEQDVARVRSGQDVELKARALPFQTFRTKVDRVAPAAGRGDVQSTIIVYCRLEEAAGDLRPEMTGYGRIFTGNRPIGRILIDRALCFFRTEFWW